MPDEVVLEHFLEANGISDTTLPSSSVHGVSPTSWGNRYQAQVMRQGNRHYLGTFESESEAVAARMQQEKTAALRSRSCSEQCSTGSPNRW